MYNAGAVLRHFAAITPHYHFIINIIITHYATSLRRHFATNIIIITPTSLIFIINIITPAPPAPPARRCAIITPLSLSFNITPLLSLRHYDAQRPCHYIISLLLFHFAAIIQMPPPLLRHYNIIINIMLLSPKVGGHWLPAAAAAAIRVVYAIDTLPVSASAAPLARRLLLFASPYMPVLPRQAVTPALRLLPRH